MAKLTQPTVKIVMIKTRQNKNGDHPLAVRVQWNGRCEKFTGIYLKEINWNSQSQRVVKMYVIVYNTHYMSTHSRMLS